MAKCNQLTSLPFKGLSRAAPDDRQDRLYVIVTWTTMTSDTTAFAVPWSSASNQSTTGEQWHDPGLPDEHRYVLIALYTTTTVLAVTGNVIVIVVLAVGQRSRTDLRAFLVNLAVADLTMAIFCMPFTFTATMLHDWIFGAAMCTIVLFLQVSIFTFCGRWV